MPSVIVGYFDLEIDQKASVGGARIGLVKFSLELYYLRELNLQGAVELTTYGISETS